MHLATPSQQPTAEQTEKSTTVLGSLRHRQTGASKIGKTNKNWQSHLTKTESQVETTPGTSAKVGKPEL